MIVLDSTIKSLEIVLSGAITTNQLPYVATYVDIDTTTQAISSVAASDGTSNSTTAVTIVSAPSAGFTRQIKFISIQNADTAAATLTLRYKDGASTRAVMKVTLAVGDNLIYTD